MTAGTRAGIFSNLGGCLSNRIADSVRLCAWIVRVLFMIVLSRWVGDRSMTEKKWQTYEDVARYLLDAFGSEFGLMRVEGKQFVPSTKIDDPWEIDAKGVSANGEAFVLIECRRKTTRGLDKESVGAFALRIRDTGAAGGIIVSPLDLQSGAQKLASAYGIRHVLLTPESTMAEYLMQFLNRLFIGMRESALASDHAEAEVIRKQPQ